VTFETDTYRIKIKAEDINLALSTAHYFDMSVSFNGESIYDKAYAKMAALVKENQLVLGVHPESTAGYFFEKAVFEVFVGEEYEGMQIDLRTINERVQRLRTEASATVEGGWASFEIFGVDCVIVAPDVE
jgi:hypothetical protein